MSGSVLKVLYVMGPPRSGTTLLSQILGEVEGLFAAGELLSPRRFRLAERYLCGCGDLVRDCPVWSVALTEVPGDAPGTDWPQIRTAIRHTLRTRRIPRLLRTDPGASVGEPADTAINYAGALYRSASRVTGAEVVIDTSKVPAGAAIARLAPGVEAYVVNMVRDPRTVAQARTRRKALPLGDRVPYLRTFSPRESALGWAAVQVGAEMVRRRFADRSLLIRYEDFAEDPERELRRILSMLGMPDRRLPLLESHVVSLGPNHIVWGNPDRFVTGRVEIVARDRQITLGLRDRLVVTAITAILMKLYGYPFRTRHAG